VPAARLAGFRAELYRCFTARRDGLFGVADAEQGAWLVFEDEPGQGLRPPKGRIWGRRGSTPVVTVTGGSNKRVSLAALRRPAHPFVPDASARA
jgi:hypothetical protein